MQSSRDNSDGLSDAIATTDAVRLLLAMGATRFGPFFRFAIATRMPLSALLALRWDDVVVNTAGKAGLRIWHTDLVQTLGRRPGCMEKRLYWSDEYFRLGDLASTALREQRALQAQNRLQHRRYFIDSGHVFQGDFGGQFAESEILYLLRQREPTMNSTLFLESLRDGLDVLFPSCETTNATVDGRPRGHIPSYCFNWIEHREVPPKPSKIRVAWWRCTMFANYIRNAIMNYRRQAAHHIESATIEWATEGRRWPY
jgi:hypothetical protein